MGKWISSTGNTVTILPWTDNGYKFITLDCEEVLGGTCAHGRIQMVNAGNDEALEMVTKENKVEVTLGTTELGSVLEFSGIITHREYLHNFLTIEFTCMPDVDFWTRKGTLVSENIDSAIKSLWRGKTDIRTSSDLPEGMVFNQSSEYDYEFLQTLCKSYRKDAIFAFGLEGLLIKDLVGIDSTGEKEPNLLMMGNTNVIQDTDHRFSLNYDPRLYMKPENLGSLLKSKYWEIWTFDNIYKFLGKDYSILQENKMNNDRIYKSKMYSQLQVMHTNFLQSYRLGDVVKYVRGGESTDVPFKTYLISKIKYHYRTEPDPNKVTPVGEFPFSLEYTLHGLEEDGEIMSDADPMA